MATTYRCHEHKGRMKAGCTACETADDIQVIQAELKDLRGQLSTEKLEHARATMKLMDQTAALQTLTQKLERATSALRSCDIALKAAKPCVNGGEHMNDQIAEEALRALGEYE